MCPLWCFSWCSGGGLLDVREVLTDFCWEGDAWPAGVSSCRRGEVGQHRTFGRNVVGHAQSVAEHAPPRAEHICGYRRRASELVEVLVADVLGPALLTGLYLTF